MKKLLPVLMLVLGLGAGVGAGWVLRPPPDEAEVAHEHGTPPDAHAAPEAAVQTAGTGHYLPPVGETETIRLPNQFVVPLIDEGRVRAMVVIGLALELAVGHDFSLARNEPRLRAVFLQLLFDHANIGGFEGIFTSGEALLALRRTLVEAARVEIGPEVQDVLITELLRQES
ncbi:MAG: flagellar basal body-associated FliL family protein [Rhodobacteraceae bacterium]|nr:flagellar basal body-associated FliL family protein [Paracoccaceae bacterium]